MSDEMISAEYNFNQTKGGNNNMESIYMLDSTSNGSPCKMTYVGEFSLNVFKTTKFIRTRFFIRNRGIISFQFEQTKWLCH